LQGTLWYISPEYMQGTPVTARSDIYALGSILYEAISGTPPCLMGIEEITTQSVTWSQMFRVPPQLDSFLPDVPAHVGQLIQRMLAKEPDKRLTNMAEAAALLRAACQRVDDEDCGRSSIVRELWRDGHGDSDTVHSGVTAVVSGTIPAFETAGTTAIENAPVSLGSHRRRLVALGVAIGAVVGAAFGLSNIVTINASDRQVASARPAIENIGALAAPSASKDFLGKPGAPSPAVALAEPILPARAAVAPAMSAQPVASSRSIPSPSAVTTTWSSFYRKKGDKNYFPPNSAPKGGPA